MDCVFSFALRYVCILTELAMEPIVIPHLQTNADEAQLGRWIFKGYIHDDRLVGRWRETSTSVEHVGWEGGFAMCKIRQ
jgi:hypothetical protein